MVEEMAEADTRTLRDYLAALTAAVVGDPHGPDPHGPGLIPAPHGDTDDYPGRTHQAGADGDDTDAEVERVPPDYTDRLFRMIAEAGALAPGRLAGAAEPVAVARPAIIATVTVTIAAAFPAMILSRNPARATATLRNTGAVAVYLNAEPGGRAPAGFPLAAGASITVTATGPLYAVCDTGTTSTVAVLTEQHTDPAAVPAAVRPAMT